MSKLIRGLVVACFVGLVLAVPCFGVDLTITAANVVISSGTASSGTAGEAVTAGQPIYLKASDSKLYKAQCDGTSAEAAAVGVALNDAASGQPLSYLPANGTINVGAVMTVGQVYVVSANAGKIAPYADLDTGKYVTILGVAKSTSLMELKINATAVAKP